MHELSLMEETMAIALDYAQQHHAREIRRIHMRVGLLSGVVPEALQFAFDVMVKGTIAETAEFSIEPVAILCHCPACDIVFEPVDRWIHECPQCHQFGVEVRQGKELELASLEVL